MGAEFRVNSLEDMCRLMCDNDTSGLEPREAEDKKEQNDLLSSLKEWSDAIDKRGYVN